MGRRGGEKKRGGVRGRTVGEGRGRVERGNGGDGIYIRIS